MEKKYHVIAKTIKGEEFFYSRIDSYIVNPKTAKLICSVLNRVSWKLDNDKQAWKVYVLSFDDYMYTSAPFQRLSIRNNSIKVLNYYSVLPGSYCNR